MERQLSDDCLISTYKALLAAGAFDDANSPQDVRANMYKLGRHVFRQDDYIRLFLYHLTQRQQQMALANPNEGNELPNDPNISHARIHSEQ
jgi:hypothetical protein